jgi:hypothetical protein
MRNLLIIALLVLLGTSCSQKFYCSKCVTKDSTYVKIKDSLAIHTDTTWRVFHNPGDSLKLADNLTAYIDSLGRCRIADASGTTESGKIKVKYIIRNDSIFINCDTKPYDIRIAELTTTIDHFHEMYESYIKTATVTTKRPRTWWTWLSYWQSWVCLGYIAFSLFKKILKLFGLKLKFAFAWPPITIGT